MERHPLKVMKLVSDRAGNYRLSVTLFSPCFTLGLPSDPPHTVSQFWAHARTFGLDSRLPFVGLTRAGSWGSPSRSGKGSHPAQLWRLGQRHTPVLSSVPQRLG